jgi:putative sporulation protein YtxC
VEDKGLVLGPLIINRAYEAQRKGCIVSILPVENSDERMTEVTVSDCGKKKENENAVLCALLADIIVENLQVRHLVRLLKQDYDFLPEKDQCEILVCVLKNLWYGSEEQRGDVSLCKQKVTQRLIALLSEAAPDTLVLEGFMRFRMKDYLEEWDRALSLGVENYIRKKEYAEFVEILRLFINIRIPRVRKVHVCVDGHGEYLLLDERLCLLKCTFLGKRIDKDDALLSALVNIAPLTIVVHNRERFWDARIIETIKDVFGKRVEFSEDMI